jgi:coenzyme F420-dependent glucose-6-phosphate dehydrogenase
MYCLFLCIIPYPSCTFYYIKESMAQIYWFCGHEQFQPETLVQHARAAEAAGFDGVMVSEHFHPWVDDVGASGFAYSTLGAMAVATTRLKLMTAVTTPLFRYHPAVVAQAAATIDRLSGGRFALGVGSGESINEAPLGYTFPKYAERSARFREALSIIRPLLDGEQLDYDGSFYQTHAAKLYSPPLHAIPIYVAAGGPKTAALAGELADGLIVSVKEPQETIENVITPARKQAGTKPLTLVATRWSVFAQNDREAHQALAAWRGLRAPSRASATNPADLQREADSLSRAEILSRYSRILTPEDFISVYGPLITELGADIIGIQTTSLDQEALIKLVGREVLPKLRQLKPKA